MKQKLYFLMVTLSMAFSSFSQQATHLNFGGSNDYVDCGNNPSLQITGNAITLEAYVKFNTFGTDHWLGNIINKAAPNSNGYMLRAGGNGAVNFVVANSGWYELTTANNAITLNTWFHIAGVYNGSTLKIYIDGVEVASTNTAIGSIGNSVSNLNLGRDPQDIIRGLDASLEEVRIWNVARTAEQINGSKNCELQGTETGLVAYYKFNQGNDASDNTAITSLLDATANANNGTLINFTKTGAVSNFLAGSPVTTGSIVPSVASVTTPVTYNQGATATALTATVGANGSSLVWYTTATSGTGTTTAPTPDTSIGGLTSYWVSSTNANGCESERTEIVVTVLAPGTYLNFDGVNDFVDLGTSNLLKPTTAITVELNAFMSDWSSAAGLETIIGNAQNGGWFIGIEGTDLVAGVRRNGGYGKALFPLSSLSSGWHHIAMDYGGGYVHMFIDGVYVSENNAGGTFPISYAVANSTIIGSEATGTPGTADLSRCFNGSVDDVRIWNSVRTPSQIANSKDCELLGTETGLIAYYKFNHGNSGVDNTGVTSLTDATANANDGILTNFALTGSTSNWLAGSPIDILPSVASVTTPVVYTQGDTATALTATVGANGTSLVWYTTATGGTGTTAPTPSTATVGSTSYWVSSTNVNGCESARTEIVVTVIAPATHLNFDGTNDFVNVGNLILTGSSYTKQAMIRPYNISSAAGHNILSNSNEVFWIWSGNIRAGNNGNFQHVLADASSLLNTWNMVTVTYDAPTTTMKLYINEILVSENNSVSATLGGNMQIGAYGSAAVFNGDIDEVRIWNKALSASDIVALKDCELQNGETGLVAYYKFNQGESGATNTGLTTLTDASGNANNGSLSGFALTGTTSNWLSGSPIVTGTTCTTLNASSFDVASNINIYPNPTNGNVNIMVNNLTNVSVSVYDLNGRQILNKEVSNNTNTIDISNLQTGMYLFRIKSSEGEVVKKVIKN